ncbi:MAG: aminopeptidase P family protein [Pseudobdellovibrionaceae bacterium]
MASSTLIQERLEALRAQMAAQKLDGFLLPRTDEFQSEFLAPYAERVAYMTGFTGSAGYAVFLKDTALVASDGRYTLQIRDQVDSSLYALADSTQIKIPEWVADHVKKGGRVGYDPRLHSPSQISGYRALFDAKGIELVPLNDNLVDQVWKDAPSRPDAEIILFDEKFAGRSAEQKRLLVADKLQEKNLTHFVISAPDSIAWLLNIRSSDVAHTPVALSYATITADGHVFWFINPDRVSDAIRAKLGNAVSLIPFDETEGELSRIAADKGNHVGLDFKRATSWFTQVLEKGAARVTDMEDPCIKLRACKVEAEREAMRIAHNRDGIVLTQFFDWLRAEAPKGALTEQHVVDALTHARGTTGVLRDESFETICGWQGNGAIIHYRVTPETNKEIKGQGLLLIDSGAQYPDGTTDITRVIALNGTPTAEEKEAYTRVLKGHIAVARAKFPEGTTGAQIDALARQPLWEAGLDFAHGTGHGVGVYLSVHEEATSISPRSHDPILEGMILSNEPGYYKEDAFGIRIENLVICYDTGEKLENGKRIFAFETITLVPFEDALIDKNLLTREEIDWVDAYHARCAENMKSNEN